VETANLAHLELLALILITFYEIVMGTKYHDIHCVRESGVIAGAME
jgi:hypothetical protein